jgi:membrane protease YdiL (CAAX protease family)
MKRNKAKKEKMPKNSKWKILGSISLGLVLVLFWGWMFLRADQLFTTNTSAWKDLLQTYIFFAVIVFGIDTLASRNTEKQLFKVSFIKAFPKFLLFALVGLVVLFLFGITLKGGALPSINQAIANVGLGVILFHAFFVATLEEKVFRGWLWNELRAGGMNKTATYVFVALVFAFFHYLINGDWTSLLLYIPLSFIFTYAKLKWSPRTDMANAGLHFAWNVFVLGFLAI